MKVIIALLVIVDLVSGADKLSDDVLLLIKKAGYTGEVHQIETVDGYLLKNHRVLPKSRTRQQFPVLLMHGISLNSVDWLIAGPNRALAYYLADAGYDVWLGNARGNKYSTNHKNLSTESHEFWNFSFHEMGIYDLPATIDHMLHTTKSSKIFYIGHSQGGAAYLVCMSMLPEYNEKVVQAHLLAPGAFVGHAANSIVPTVAAIINDGYFNNYAYIDFRNLFDLSNEISQMFCTGRPTPTNVAFCESIFFVIVGRNKNGIETDRQVLKAVIPKFSPRTSVKQLAHFTQIHLSDKFESFDYGSESNVGNKSTKPTQYPLENVKTPVYIYGAAEDTVIGRSVSVIFYLINFIYEKP